MSDWALSEGVCSFCGKTSAVMRRATAVESICRSCVGSSIELIRPDDPPLTDEQFEARMSRDLEDLELSARNLPERERAERLAIVAAIRAGDHSDGPETCSFCGRNKFEIERMIVASAKSICDICRSEAEPASR